MAAALLLFAAVCAPRPVFAQAESGAQSLLIDPSVRASGMGRASTAVFWGGDPNHWANPALLGYHKGVRYEWGRTQLVPDLSDDVFFRTKRLTLGYGGVALFLAGEPGKGMGSQRLDYGISEATDIDGNPIGEFRSYEDIRSVGFAGNVLEIASSVGRLAGVRAIDAVTRYGDVSLGWTAKRTEVNLAPASVTIDRLEARGEVTTYDTGILARVAPYNSIDYPGLLPAIDRIVSLRVDVSHGRSTQNYNEAKIPYIDPDQADPVARISRRGWATRVAVDLPRPQREQWRGRRLGWLLGLTSPLLQWGKAWDRLLPSVHDPDTGVRTGKTRIYDAGWELTVAGIYTIRRGRVDDPQGTIQATTSGWGLGLNWEDVAGFRYDRATVPQSRYLKEDVDREGFTAFLAPGALWKRLDRREGGPPPGREPIRVGLAVFGGYQAYSMSDVNDAIRDPDPLFPGAVASVDRIEGGASFGAGLRLQPPGGVAVHLDAARLRARTSGSATFLGSTYTGELSVPATSVAVTLLYMLPPLGRVQLGAGGGAGFYACDGEATASGPGTAYRVEIEGTGFGLHAQGVGDLALAGPLHAEIAAGYRHARTTDVSWDGAVLREPDGSRPRIDWSGLMARAGLTVYVGGGPAAESRRR